MEAQGFRLNAAGMPPVHDIWYPRLDFRPVINVSAHWFCWRVSIELAPSSYCDSNCICMKLLFSAFITDWGETAYTRLYMLELALHHHAKSAHRRKTEINNVDCSRTSKILRPHEVEAWFAIIYKSNLYVDFQKKYLNNKFLPSFCLLIAGNHYRRSFQLYQIENSRKVRNNENLYLLHPYCIQLCSSQSRASCP